jgi:hypothetical protein
MKPLSIVGLGNPKSHIVDIVYKLTTLINYSSFSSLLIRLLFWKFSGGGPRYVKTPWSCFQFNLRVFPPTKMHKCPTQFG